MKLFFLDKVCSLVDQRIRQDLEKVCILLNYIEDKVEPGERLWFGRLVEKVGPGEGLWFSRLEEKVGPGEGLWFSRLVKKVGHGEDLWFSRLVEKVGPGKGLQLSRPVEKVGPGEGFYSLVTRQDWKGFCMWLNKLVEKVWSVVK